MTSSQFDDWLFTGSRPSSTRCEGSNTDWNCCSSMLCEEDEGDCDTDSECKGNLVCGTNNCPSDFPDDRYDCCTYDKGLLINCVAYVYAAVVLGWKLEYVVIKILTKPCYTRHFDWFSWGWSKNYFFKGAILHTTVLWLTKFKELLYRCHQCKTLFVQFVKV